MAPVWPFSPVRQVGKGLDGPPHTLGKEEENHEFWWVLPSQGRKWRFGGTEIDPMPHSGDPGTCPF